VARPTTTVVEPKATSPDDNRRALSRPASLEETLERARLEEKTFCYAKANVGRSAAAWFVLDDGIPKEFQGGNIEPPRIKIIGDSIQFGSEGDYPYFSLNRKSISDATLEWIINDTIVSMYPENEGWFIYIEKKPPYYSRETVRERTRDLNARARDLGLSFEQGLKALQREAAAGARETTGRAKAEPRLKWEKDALPDENPAAFAWRAYKAEAEAGTLHRGLVGREDKSLAVKLASWLRTHDMPEGIDIPTLPEWNTRQLAKLNGEAERDVLRLYEVAKKRKSKLAPAT
jgi:hypothetical protein